MQSMLRLGALLFRTSFLQTKKGALRTLHSSQGSGASSSPQTLPHSFHPRSSTGCRQSRVLTPKEPSNPPSFHSEHPSWGWVTPLLQPEKSTLEEAKSFPAQAYTWGKGRPATQSKAPGILEKRREILPTLQKAPTAWTARGNELLSQPAWPSSGQRTALLPQQWFP